MQVSSITADGKTQDAIASSQNLIIRHVHISTLNTICFTYGRGHPSKKEVEIN